jgi:hypothetical protein
MGHPFARCLPEKMRTGSAHVNPVGLAGA